MTTEQFIALRLQAGCTQRVWAELLGVSQHTVKRIEYAYAPGVPQGIAHLAALLGDATIRARAWGILAREINTARRSPAPDATAGRLAALERHLQQYLGKPRAVTRGARMAQRNHTRAERVILNNLRRQRALLTNGHEQDWTHAILTQDDWERAATLLAEKAFPYSSPEAPYQEDQS